MSIQIVDQWTDSSGAKIEVYVYRYLDIALVGATVNGVREVGVVQPYQGCVNGIPVTAKFGRVDLTAERAAGLEAARALWQAAIEAEPAVQLRHVIARRKALAEARGFIIAARHEHQRRVTEQASGGAPYSTPPKDFAADLEIARAALAAFDAQHPEALAEIAAECAASRARFRAAD